MKNLNQGNGPQHACSPLSKFIDSRRLVIEITKAIRRLNLTPAEAAERMGITQPKVSALLGGEFSNLSERKLMDCLNRLGYDIEIKVRPATKRTGHLKLAIM